MNRAIGTTEIGEALEVEIGRVSSNRNIRLSCRTQRARNMK